MGNTYDVYIWEKFKEGDAFDCYKWTNVYSGEDMAKALSVMIHEKEKGAGCVKLEWR